MVAVTAAATADETMPINISNEMDKYLHTEGAAANGNVLRASCAVAGSQHIIQNCQKVCTICLE